MSRAASKKNQGRRKFLGQLELQLRAPNFTKYTSDLKRAKKSAAKIKIKTQIAGVSDPKAKLKIKIVNELMSKPVAMDAMVVTATPKRLSGSKKSKIKMPKAASSIKNPKLKSIII